MRKLYEINADLIAAIEYAERYAEENDGVVSEDIVYGLEGLQMEREAKIEGVALYIKELIAYEEAIKVEEARLKAEKLRNSKKIDGLKGWLSSALNGDKFKTVQCSVSFRKSESVSVDDETMIPAEYIVEKITTAPDKVAIKKALKEGADIDGVHLVTSNNIQVK